jgi:uncharacterized protein YjiS (DUF1127 family)
MQQAASHKLATLGPGVGFAAALRRTPLALPRAIFERLGSWQRQAEERAHLTRLSDHQLQDMGLSRGDVEDMARKPLWQR